MPALGQRKSPPKLHTCENPKLRVARRVMPAPSSRPQSLRAQFWEKPQNSGPWLPWDLPHIGRLTHQELIRKAQAQHQRQHTGHQSERDPQSSLPGRRRDSSSRGNPPPGTPTPRNSQSHLPVSSPALPTGTSLPKQLPRESENKAQHGPSTTKTSQPPSPPRWREHHSPQLVAESLARGDPIMSLFSIP